MEKSKQMRQNEIPASIFNIIDSQVNTLLKLGYPSSLKSISADRYRQECLSACLSAIKEMPSDYICMHLEAGHFLVLVDGRNPNYEVLARKIGLDISSLNEFFDGRVSLDNILKLDGDNSPYIARMERNNERPQKPYIVWMKKIPIKNVTYDDFKAGLGPGQRGADFLETMLYLAYYPNSIELNNNALAILGEDILFTDKPDSISEEEFRRILNVPYSPVICRRDSPPYFLTLIAERKDKINFGRTETLIVLK